MGVITSARERRLARSAARGDPEALRSLYLEYSEQLFATAYRLMESSADARDVLHDVFCKLPRAIRRFDPERPLGPWLRRVTTRAALDRIRTERRLREVPIDSAQQELPAAASSELLLLDSIAVERALSSLSEELRTVVVLKEMEGYSHRQITELLQISLRTSERRLHEARELLRARLFDGTEM